jgi:hypothetical protein
MDDKTLIVKRVVGGPRLVDGEYRDVIRIEVDDSIDTETLEKLFKDNPNTFVLYTANGLLDDGDIVYTSESKLMCQGYTIFAGIEHEDRTIPHKPGLLLPDTEEHLNIISLAQMTYDEYKESVYYGGE